MGRPTFTIAEFQRRMEIVAQSHELGIPLILGPDARTGITYDDFAYGAVCTCEQVYRPWPALRSSTSTATRALGIADTTGSLVAGLDADVIAVDGDPLADITSVQRVAFVLRQGAANRASGTGGIAPSRAGGPRLGVG